MNWWRNLSLAVRVPVLVALLMIAVALVASQLVLAALDRQQSARIRELASQHVEALSVALGPHVLRKDIWEIYDTLERAAGERNGRRVVFSAVADTKGRILAATDPKRAPVDSPIAPLAASAERPDALSVDRNERRIRLVAPLVYQGRQVGQIVTELDISDLIAERAEARKLLLLGNVFVTAILALLGYAATRRMLLPVTRLMGRMQEIDGTPRPIPPGEMPAGDSEMARLVQTYNQMVATMAEKAEVERRLAERERFVSLGRLASSLAHEINNPLGGLLNATDTIQRYADRPEVVRQSAALLDRGLRHMRDVTKATLELNRLERTSQPLEAEDFDDLHLLIEPEIRHRGQTLEWQVDLGEGFEARLPAAPVRQIALNLLLNASQAARAGGHVGFRVRVDRQARLEMIVEDDGPGLGPAARERLLGAGPVPPGGGVGLRMVHELTERLGGEIKLLDAGGKGSRICVRLPLSSDTAQEESAAEEMERSRETAAGQEERTGKRPAVPPHDTRVST